MSVNFAWLYKFSTATTAPPSGSAVRLDATDYAAVSRVWIPYTTSDGTDIYRALTLIPADAWVYLQDQNDHTEFARYRAAAAAIDRGGYVELPVVFVSTGGLAIANNQSIALFVATVAEAPPVPAPGTGLVSLAEACAHLRIPDPGTDPDLELKLAAAEAIILDYLNLTLAMRDTTATWTAATVPLTVKHAILLELGELWRFRGDDPEAPPRWPPSNAEGGIDLAPAIVGLLRRVQPLVVS